VHPRKLLILKAAGVARSAGIAVVGYSFGTHRSSRNTAGLKFVRTPSQDVHPDRMARRSSGGRVLQLMLMPFAAATITR
jgi:hypothetical protein